MGSVIFERTLSASDSSKYRRLGCGAGREICKENERSNNMTVSQETLKKNKLTANKKKREARRLLAELLPDADEATIEKLVDALVTAAVFEMAVWRGIAARAKERE